MLYKKYHRDYVKQFKKGTKFVFNSSIYSGITIRNMVEVEPFWDRGIYVTEKFSDGNWALVDYNGKVNYYEIEVEKDVIQEISQELY